jgi:hypothetical protein
MPPRNPFSSLCAAICPYLVVNLLLAVSTINARLSNSTTHFISFRGASELNVHAHRSALSIALALSLRPLHSECRALDSRLSVDLDIRCAAAVLSDLRPPTCVIRHHVLRLRRCDACGSLGPRSSIAPSRLISSRTYSYTRETVTRLRTEPSANDANDRRD